MSTWDPERPHATGGRRGKGEVAMAVVPALFHGQVGKYSIIRESMGHVTTSGFPDSNFNL